MKQQQRQRRRTQNRRQWNTTGRNCGYRGIGNDEPLTPPREPTLAAGGSAERVAVYERRVSEGVGLYHPADGRKSRAGAVDLN